MTRGEQGEASESLNHAEFQLILKAENQVDPQVNFSFHVNKKNNNFLMTLFLQNCQV